MIQFTGKPYGFKAPNFWALWFLHQKIYLDPHPKPPQETPENIYLRVVPVNWHALIIFLSQGHLAQGARGAVVRSEDSRKHPESNESRRASSPKCCNIPPCQGLPKKNRSTEETGESRFKLKTFDVNSGVPGSIYIYLYMNTHVYNMTYLDTYIFRTTVHILYMYRIIQVDR